MLNIERERAAFEAWLNPGGHYGNVPKDGDRYTSQAHGLAWLAWKARAALAAAPQVSAGYKLLKDTTHDERQWHEDAKHENGSYFNECVRCLRSFVGHKRRGVCRACAQPEVAPGAPQPAEPVAWRIFDGEGGYDFRDELPSEESRAWSARYGRKWEPLYAHPAAAPKPLTREQIVRIYEVPELAGTEFETGTEKAIAVARAIEAAHGICAADVKEPNADFGEFENNE